MAFDTDNKAIVAFKNLLGKSNTDVAKELGNEAEGIFFNVRASDVWIDQIPNDPADAVTAGIAQSVTADMVEDVTSNGHAFFAVFPAAISSGIGVLETGKRYVVTSSTASHNSVTYNQGEAFTAVNDDLDSGTVKEMIKSAISPSHGVGYEAKPFDGASPIPVGDPRDWIFQYNSGVFFQQDNVGGDPTTVELFVYIGTTLAEGGGAAGTEWQDSVLSIETDPSSLTPNEGDRFLIGSGAIGIWSGLDDQIAEWNGVAYEYFEPTDGTTVKVDDDDDSGQKFIPYHYEGDYPSGSWERLPALNEDLFDANTILKADTDNTPEALTVPEDTIIGRKSGDVIDALTASEVKTILGTTWAETLSSGNRALGNDVIVDPTGSVSDNSFLNSPDVIVRSKYDSDPGAGITESDFDTRIRTVVTAAGATVEGYGDILVDGNSMMRMHHDNSIDTLGTTSANPDTLHTLNLELQGNVLGKYTVQPDTQGGYDDLTIITRKVLTDAIAAVQGSMEWQDSVLSIEDDSSTLSPSSGDRFLVDWTTTALNDFAGHEGEIAEWNGSSYDFTSPSIGFAINVDNDSNKIYFATSTSPSNVWTGKDFLPPAITDQLARYNGSAWVAGSWNMAANPNGAFYPATDGAQDLGRTTERIRDIYMDSIIDFGTELIMNESGTERMRIATGGYIGLGASHTSAALVHLDNTDVAANELIRMTDSGGQTRNYFYDDGTIGFGLNGSVESGFPYTFTGNGGIALRGSGLKLRIDSDGTSVDLQITDRTMTSGSQAYGWTVSGDALRLNTYTDLFAGTSSTDVIVVAGGATSNVGIGALGHSSAILDITSTNRGFGLPSMTTAQRDAISSPRAGLQIYNTDTDFINYYNGISWVVVESSATGLDDWESVLAEGNTSGGSDAILDAAASGDNVFTDSPKLILRGTYDADPGAGVTSTNYDVEFVHNMTSAGASPTSQLDINIGGSLRLSLLNDGTILPVDGADLGDNTHRLSTIYTNSNIDFASGSNLVIQQNGTDVLTFEDSTLDLVVASPNSIKLGGGAGVNIRGTGTGDGYFSGAAQLEITTDNIGYDDPWLFLVTSGASPWDALIQSSLGGFGTYTGFNTASMTWMKLNQDTVQSGFNQFAMYDNDTQWEITNARSISDTTDRTVAFLIAYGTADAGLKGSVGVAGHSLTMSNDWTLYTKNIEVQGGNLTVIGEGAASATTAVHAENSSGNQLLNVRDDGRFVVGDDSAEFNKYLRFTEAGEFTLNRSTSQDLVYNGTLVMTSVNGAGELQITGTSARSQVTVRANTGGYRLAFATEAGNADMQISSAGNLYIGVDESTGVDAAVRLEVRDGGGIMLSTDPTVVNDAINNPDPLTFRAVYDADETAGITATNWDATIEHIMTSGGTSPASRMAFSIDGTEEFAIYSSSVGIGLGGSAVTTDVIFEVASTTKAAVPNPIMTTTQRNAIGTPSTGMSIYNSTTNDIEFYNGTSWVGTAGSNTLVEVLIAGNTSGANDLIFSKTGTASSTATQVGSQKVQFEMSLWDGVAEDVQYWDIEAIASTTVNQNSRLAFSVDGSEEFAIYSSSVGIGLSGAAVTADTIFEVSSTSKAAIPAPKMTTTQRNAITPVEGMMIYNTNGNAPQFYDGTQWVTVNEGNGIYGGDGSLSEGTQVTLGGFPLQFLGGTSDRFEVSPNIGFGTTAATSYKIIINAAAGNEVAQFRADNTDVMRVYSTQQVSVWGDLGVGVTAKGATTAKLHVKGDGSTSATRSLQVEDSLGTDLLVIRDDGLVGIGVIPQFGAKLQVRGAGNTATDYLINAQNASAIPSFLSSGDLTNSFGGSGVGAAIVNILNPSSFTGYRLRVNSDHSAINFTISKGGYINAIAPGIGLGVTHPESGYYVQIRPQGTDQDPLKINRESDNGIIFAVTNERNIGIGIESWGTNADTVLAIKNGTPPTTSVGDAIQIYSKDSSDGATNATLALQLEQAVEAIGTFTASHKIKVWINGTEYWLQLDAV